MNHQAKWAITIVSAAMLLALAACNGAASSTTRVPSPAATELTTQPAASATQSEEQAFEQKFGSKPDITLADSGKTITVTPTTRFMVFLDDERYPVSELKCDPDGMIGYVSNGSFGGPGRYPIMYEALQTGSCTLQDRDFKVQINIAPPTPTP